MYSPKLESLMRQIAEGFLCQVPISVVWRLLYLMVHLREGELRGEVRNVKLRDGWEAKFRNKSVSRFLCLPAEC